MADNSKIEWCDATWNVVTGCNVTSPACNNCYAMRLAGTRLREHPSRKGLTKIVKGKPVWTGEVRFNEEWLTQPLQWKRPRKIFVAAHGDLFHENVPDEWIDRVFAVMALAPQHQFMVLTKRASRMLEYFTNIYCEGFTARDRIDNVVLDWVNNASSGDVFKTRRIECIADGYDACERWPLPNVTLGVTAEDQEHADERIPYLLATPSAKRFVSIEPMLAPIDLTKLPAPPVSLAFPQGFTVLDALRGRRLRPNEPSSFPRRKVDDGLDLVIVGGESGPGSRPMHPDWPRSLRDQCAAAGAQFMFKQWGDWFPRDQWEGNPKLILPDDDDAFNCTGSSIFRFEDQVDGIQVMHRVGKSRAGRLLDGKEHNGDA